MTKALPLFVIVIFSSLAFAQPATMPSEIKAVSVDPWVRKKGIGFVSVRRPTSQPSTTQPIDMDLIWQREIRSQATQMTTYALLEGFVDNSEELHKTEWWKQFDSHDKAIDWLSEHLDVRVIEGTDLIGIKLTGQVSNADRKFIIREVVSNQLMRERQLIQNELFQQSVALNNRKDGLRIALANLTKSIDQLVEKKDLTSSEVRNLELKKEAEKRLREEMNRIQYQLDDLNQRSIYSGDAKVKWVIGP